MANRISDRQIELLTKIYNKSATDIEIKDFLALVVKDNVLGMEKLPTVAFIPKDKMGDAYAMQNDEELEISFEVIDDVKQDPQNIMRAINALGHELRHYNQHKSLLDDFITEEGKNRQAKIDHDLYTYDEASGEYLTSLLTIQSAKGRKILTQYFENYKGDEFADWYLGLSDDDHKHIHDYLEESRYLGSAHEIDARAGGIIYSTLVFEKYLRDERIQKNAKLHSWLAKIKQKGAKKYLQDYEEDMEYTEFYDEYNKASQNISKELLQDIAERVASLQKDNSIKRQTFEALLYLASKQYTKSIDEQQLKLLFRWCAQNINEQNTDGSAKPERVLACALANSIYFDERIDSDNRNAMQKELLDVYLAHASFDKKQMTAESGIHKFDNFDTFILHITSLSGDQGQFKLMEQLDGHKRYSEICDIIDFKKLYKAEEDIEGKLPEDYLNNIKELLAAKCEMLFAIRKEFIGQKFSHIGDAKRLEWYLSQVQRTKKEVEYMYCKQEDKKLTTDQEIDEFYDNMKEYLKFDLNYLDLAEREAQEKMQSHPALFAQMGK